MVFVKGNSKGSNKRRAEKDNSNAIILYPALTSSFLLVRHSVVITRNKFVTTTAKVTVDMEKANTPVFIVLTASSRNR